MPLSEKEIEEILYETGHGKGYTHAEYRAAAAYAIAAKMREGVVWEAVFKATDLGECTRLVSLSGDTEIRTERGNLEHEGLYRVTVRKEEADGQDKD
uniref:Uncharacterized protein n=1 Tax=viral metagenome TaxID=1070528 RepID=A0A6M3X5J3_9ZZZZ